MGRRHQVSGYLALLTGSLLQIVLHILAVRLAARSSRLRLLMRCSILHGQYQERDRSMTLGAVGLSLDLLDSLSHGKV